jgi:hypothetical protein
MQSMMGAMHICSAQTCTVPGDQSDLGDPGDQGDQGDVSDEVDDATSRQTR